MENNIEFLTHSHHCLNHFSGLWNLGILITISEAFFINISIFPIVHKRGGIIKSEHSNPGSAYDSAR